MSGTKRALSAGQAESAEECAGARIEGERNNNPQKILYHGNNGSSIPKKKNLPFGMGFVDKTCAWCGKNFVPTRPEYAWGDCCSYTCCLRYDEKKQDALKIAREVVLLNPETREDVMLFDSAKAAADFANVSANDIRKACNGATNTSGGYGWRWADEKPLSARDIIPTYEAEQKAKMSIVMCSSAYERLEKIADKRGVSRNKVAAEILEKALLKKEYDL